MKKCPYCAEEIQDAAIKCRYCQSWLVDEIPAGAETPPAGAVVHEPVPTPAEGTTVVEAAVEEPTAAEPALAEAQSEQMAAAGAEMDTSTAERVEEPTSTVTVTPSPTASQPEFTHSGERYLLGYTDQFFGIWDRESPAEPSERFPRTDDGWRDAWQRYVALETNWMDLRTGQRSS